MQKKRLLPLTAIVVALLMVTTGITVFAGTIGNIGNPIVGSVTAPAQVDAASSVSKKPAVVVAANPIVLAAEVPTVPTPTDPPAPSPEPTAPPTPTPVLVLLGDATATALDKAGGTDGKLVSVKLCESSNPPKYEFKISAGGLIYDIEIDAVLGTVISVKSHAIALDGQMPGDDCDDCDDDCDDGKSIVTDPAALPVDVILKTQAEAEAIALAKLAELAVVGVIVDSKSSKLDKDDHKYEWEIRITAGGFTYEIDVDAVTGAVLCVDKEDCKDDGKKPEDKDKVHPTPKPTTLAPAVVIIDEAAAKVIVLKQEKLAGGTITSSKLDRDDKTPKYEMIVTAGGFTYEIEINAVTGIVLCLDKVDSDDNDDKDDKDGKDDNHGTAVATSVAKGTKATEVKKGEGSQDHR